MELSFQHPLDKEIFSTHHLNTSNPNISDAQKKEIMIVERNLDYNLTMNLRALHLKSRKVIGEMVACLLQASLIHGITNYDLLLKPIHYIYVEGLKERGVVRVFYKPRNLEFQFNNLIEEIGEQYIVDSLLLQEGNLKYTDSMMEKYDNFRFENVIKKVERDKALMMEEFQNLNLEEGRQVFNVDESGQLFNFDAPKDVEIINQSVSVQIQGIYLSSYIRNPIPIKNPICFIDDVSSNQFRLNFSNLFTRSRRF